jgi:hypothetical protein
VYVQPRTVPFADHDDRQTATPVVAAISKSVPIVPTSASSTMDVFDQMELMLHAVQQTVLETACKAFEDCIRRINQRCRQLCQPPNVNVSPSMIEPVVMQSGLEWPVSAFTIGDTASIDRVPTILYMTRSSGQGTTNYCGNDQRWNGFSNRNEQNLLPHILLTEIFRYSKTKRQFIPIR